MHFQYPVFSPPFPLQMRYFGPDVHFTPTQDTYWEYFVAVNKHSLEKIQLPVFEWPTNMEKIPISVLLRDR